MVGPAPSPDHTPILAGFAMLAVEMRTSVIGAWRAALAEAAGQPFAHGSGDRPYGISPRAATSSASAESLTPALYANELAAAAGTLWCIAVAIVGSRERAEDVMQDAAVVGLGKLNEFRMGTSFQQWMGQIVRFTALNHLRRNQRAANGAELEHIADRQAGAAHNADDAVFDAAVSAALASLSEQARACLLMKTVMGMPYSQISLALGIPENTAMSHVHRARAAMRERLGGREHPNDGAAT